MIEALEAYLREVDKSGDHSAGVIAAAEAVADTPWEVVRVAGLLARCKPVVATGDIGLTRKLSVTHPAGARAVVTVEEGRLYPALDHVGRRSRGAFDTPVDMARRVVASAIDAVRGELRTCIDTACGTGAFLLAAHEAGVPEIYGTDIDATALAVAQIAVPSARLLQEDALKHGPPVDLVIGNPPFVPPERQDAALRSDLRRRFPWLEGRFDLAIPFAASAVERVRPGGAAGLVLPAGVMVQNYGAVLRRRWLERHRIAELSGPHPFPGAAVDVMLVVLGVKQERMPLPVYGITPGELLRLDNVPLNPDLMPGDVDLVERIRRDSVELGDLATVDTGLVAHGPAGGKGLLIFDEPGPGRVPYADAREFFAGDRSWLQYDPSRMHRAKKPSLFERPKIVIQRLRGKGPVRASVDNDGVYVGHTCTVVVPESAPFPIERLLALIRSPYVDAITRIEQGQRLDLYPADVRRFPVPKPWLRDPTLPLEDAMGLSRREVERLTWIARG
ncbi:MAG: N-6 DNA methylase [Myxococcota bacterium]